MSGGHGHAEGGHHESKGSSVIGNVLFDGFSKTGVAGLSQIFTGLVGAIFGPVGIGRSGGGGGHHDDHAHAHH